MARGNWSAMFVRKAIPECPGSRGPSLVPAAFALGWVCLGLFGAAYMFGFIADPIPAKQAARIETGVTAEKLERLHLELEAMTTRVAALESSFGSLTAAIPAAPEPRTEQAAQPESAGPVQVAVAPLPAEGFGDEGAGFTALPIENGGATRTLFAVALAVTDKKEKLRGNWRELTARHGKILEGLEPRSITETRAGARRWKLVAGPFPNAADAAKVCARLRSEKRACAEMIFAGEAL